MSTQKKSEMLIYFEEFTQELLENPELYNDETENEIETGNETENETRNETEEGTEGAINQDYAEVMKAITNVLKNVFPETPQSIVCSKEGATLYYYSLENNEPIEIIIQPDVVKDILEKNNKFKENK